MTSEDRIPDVPFVRHSSTERRDAPTRRLFVAVTRRRTRARTRGASGSTRTMDGIMLRPRPEALVKYTYRDLSRFHGIAPRGRYRLEDKVEDRSRLPISTATEAWQRHGYAQAHTGSCRHHLPPAANLPTLDRPRRAPPRVNAGMCPPYLAGPRQLHTQIMALALFGRESTSSHLSKLPDGLSSRRPNK